MPEITKKLKCEGCCYKQNIFKLLDKRDLEVIEQNRYEVRFKPGETIFKQGTALTHIACVTSGYAKIFIEGICDKNLIIKILKPNEMVGGPGMYTDFKFHYTVTALTEVRSCFIDVNDFKKAIEMNSKFAFEILKHTNSQAIRNFKKFINLTQKHMHGRIADAIFYLSDNIYKSDHFETPISRQDLADMTAMTKESAIRILKKFKDDEIIDVNGNNFRIMDRESLINISKKG
jgi:CRP/FNR family transcriptional regulator